MTGLPASRIKRAQTVSDVVEDLRLDLIAECADRAGVYAQRAASASRRRDKLRLAVRLRQLRVCAAAIIETCEEIADRARERAP